jgi:hypothetical protein
MKRTKPRQGQLEILEGFGRGELSLESLHAELSQIIGRPVRKNPMMRHFGLNGVPERSIQIMRAHLENVLRRRRSKKMTDQDLIDWATMIMLNDAFYWDWNDDVLAEWINRLHLDFFSEG